MRKIIGVLVHDSFFLSLNRGFEEETTEDVEHEEKLRHKPIEYFLKYEKANSTIL